MGTGRSALIVASDEYQDPGLSRLRAPAHDAEALARALRAPEIGAFDVRTMLNEPAYVISEAVEEFFADRARDDLLLMHFSCHGVKDEDGELYFATANTKLRRLGATAVAADFVNRRMSRSRSRRVVLLLDCCYAGAFERGMTARAGSAVGIEDRFGGRGRAVITASSALEYAFEGEELADARDPTPSVFTRALVEGLESGDADRDQDGLIGLDELYDYVYDKVREVTPNQTPGKWTFGVQGELYIARRSRPVSTPAPLPAGLAEALDHPLAGIRAGALQELERILRGRHAGRSLAARLALERLADDDSRTVATAARAALEAPASAPEPFPAPAAPEPPSDAPPPEPPPPDAAQAPGRGEPDRLGTGARNGARSRRRIVPWLVGGAVGIVALIIGVSNIGGGSRTPPAGGEVALQRVGLALNSFADEDPHNAEARSGAAEAKRKYGDRLDLKTVSQPEDKAREVLDDLVSDGYRLILAVGNPFQDEIAGAARRHRSATTYALLDEWSDYCDSPRNRNLVCVEFNEWEGSFLAGAAAALTSKSHVVGLISGEPEKPDYAAGFEDGFRAGVAYVDKREGTSTRPLANYTDYAPATARRRVLEQREQGADVVYVAAGDSPATEETVKVALSEHIYLIGQDVDVSAAFPSGKQWILTSIVYQADKAVTRIIDKYQTDGSLHGAMPLGIAADVIDYTATNPQLGDDTRRTLDGIKRAIKSGSSTIEVPS